MPTSAPIVFYDIPSKLPINCWSPNLWKIRYALNFKRVPYETVWVEYPDIEALCKDLGGAPTATKADGRPHYTLPMIHDRSTGAVITDSINIATYLDAAYPDLPRLMPAGTTGLHRAFDAAANALMMPLYPYALPASNTCLNPASEAYFRLTREQKWGKPLEELAPRGAEDEAEWKKVKDAFGKFDEWTRANGDGSRHIMGDELCYADMWVGGFAQWIKLVLPEKWEDIKTWHDGRWVQLLKDLEKYETV